MCGITGIFNRGGRAVDGGVLGRMTDMLQHRGPDGRGQHIDRYVGLGHRRLEILDPGPAGAQPMSVGDDDHVLTYNGEIYNFVELRAELESLGHRFVSRTDSEVALHAFQQWGPGCVDRFNGMFAFAVWSRESQTLFLARDRCGIKPLYYVELGDTFIFASEVKAFLRHPDFSVDLSLPHLLEYLTFQNILTDGTLFSGVKLLPPGHCMTVTRDQVQRRQYWDFDFNAQDDGASPAAYAAELDARFERAVKRHLVSDVPVGAYLSGGLDSGSITAVAAHELPHLQTFCCGFDMSSVSGLEISFDERARAEGLSSLFKTDHYEVVLKAGDMERCLPKLVWHLEDLRVGQSYPNFHVAGLASRFVKVTQSGVGGDELFAGYPWRYHRGDGDGEDHVERYYRAWHRLIPNRLMPSLFRDEAWGEIKSLRTVDLFRDVLKGAGPEPRGPDDFVNRSLYFEAKTFLPGLLVVEDKLSMAWSLETRVPFLDSELVDFAQRVPVALKLGPPGPTGIDENDLHAKHLFRTREGKKLLRTAMASRLPPATLGRTKQGFSGPDASWFRGESLQYVRDTIWNRKARLYEYLDPSAVQMLASQHLDGVQNRRLLLWSLLNLELWCRIFLDGEHPA